MTDQETKEMLETTLGPEIDKMAQEVLQEVNISEIEQLPTIQDAEWCFQFFNNEPIVFAWSNEGEEPTPLVLQIQPKDGDGLNFQQNGMTFRIFPRPISEETKKERDNASQNKEA
jgi:hypothetical protein